MKPLSERRLRELEEQAVAGKQLFVIYVETLRLDQVSNDWQPEAHQYRKWGVRGVISDRSSAHGLVYEVTHEDGTKGWYEPRELKLVNARSADVHEDVPALLAEVRRLRARVEQLEQLVDPEYCSAGPPPKEKR